MGGAGLGSREEDSCEVGQSGSLSGVSLLEGSGLRASGFRAPGSVDIGMLSASQEYTNVLMRLLLINGN